MRGAEITRVDYDAIDPKTSRVPPAKFVTVPPRCTSILKAIPR